MRSSVVIGALAVFVTASSHAQQRPAARNDADWPMYRHDLAGTGYSRLTQITPANVARLTQAWTYRLQSNAAPAAPAGRGGAVAGVNSQATPIVIDSVMYLPAANRVVALEAETGKEIWQYSVTSGAPSRRGVAYWPGEATASPRISDPV
jgi:glucose dehydrogenase